MSTSSKDFIKPSDKSMDPRTKDWIHRLAEGMKVLATNEAERRKIDA